MRILIISDVHANAAALDAVLKDAGSFDKVWCLGDVVGYGPDPNECIERLRGLDLLCLAGNHDLGVTGKAALWDFSANAQEVIFWTRHWLTSENMQWLKSLPAVPIIQDGVTLVHASLRDPVWEYLFEREIVVRNLSQLSTPLCLNGHTHFPVIFRKPWDGFKVLEESLPIQTPLKLSALDQMFINPGSVGQPRDEDPRAAYAVLDLETNTLTHFRAAYDINATQERMKQAKFSPSLIRRLRFGQ